MAIDFEKIKELDSHWGEVMALAEKFGFILDNSFDTAVLTNNGDALSTSANWAETVAAAAKYGFITVGLEHSILISKHEVQYLALGAMNYLLKHEELFK